jgi:small conductance mechanosensitive channel
MDDPAPVIRVGELADSSVNFDVWPWVKADDYWPVRSELIEQIKLAFDENDITIPYPQMNVHFNKSEA